MHKDSICNDSNDEYQEESSHVEYLDRKEVRLTMVNKDIYEPKSYTALSISQLCASDTL